MAHYEPNHVLDLDAASCPIVGIAYESREHDSQWHAHQRTQLLYLTEGAVTLQTAERIGHLAPLQAIWLPEGVRHRAVMHGRFAYRSLYFDVQTYRDLPRAAVIIEVSQLLRELIVRVTEWPIDDALTDARTRLVSVLLDELEAAPASPLYLPMPRDRRLGAIANALVDDPSEQRTLDEWADRVGASARTLARLFVRETGLTYVQWRTRCRLLVAQTRLAEGASITEVAHAVGYASDSAFIAMYRRLYGEPPGRRNRIRHPG
ncbi:AraC family transcriptional regulator [Burkholderia ambifaria]|uniref:Transcriptional regulator, AraC family n=1 Tax=Burkholderia ambifaria MEX-5 TaxID=396597 RepID=B1TGD6_9BURK|nr:helix-turn-helix transcriptional regulator [Burkholderia ambifaria]EDT37371.1 transcriptional regulator, AraC family [Burkholderia ambifaria MEX-5]